MINHFLNLKWVNGNYRYSEIFLYKGLVCKTKNLLYYNGWLQYSVGGNSN